MPRELRTSSQLAPPQELTRKLFTQRNLRRTPMRKLSRMRKLAFLLGAGCYLVAQQPATDTLQKQIDAGHAAEALQQLDANSNTPNRDRLRGEALYALNRLPEAEQALAAAPADDLVATELRGLTLYRLGRPKDAIPLLERAHRWTPETKADPAYILALCYMDTLRFDDARHAFAEQFHFAPDSAEAHLLAARMLLRREYAKVAQDEAIKALALDRQLVGAHFLLGEVALAQERLDDAVTEFTAEASRDPLNGNVYERLGDALQRKSDYDAAAESDG